MMHDLLILGAGPAGLAAASYALRKNLDIQLVARDLGGKTNLRVDFPDAQAHQVLRAHELVHGFRSTVEYLSHAHAIAAAKSVTAHDGQVDLEVTGDTGGSRSLSARCLIVATGVRPKPLRVPGETEFFGKALGYSSISYSHILAGRRVFLVGDSQRTVDDARELAWQAKEVILLLHHAGRYESLYREQIAELDNVTLIEGMQVSEFRGSSYCEAAVLTDPEGSREIIEADAFFVQLQPEPQSAIVSDLVETDAEGRIVVDMRNRTTRPGVFAAGDVTNVGFEQILIALGEGSKAALSAYQYLMHRG